MAEPFDTLMQVQEHDTTLDQLRHRVETLPERAELAEVERRRAALGEAIAAVSVQVDDLTARQRHLEEQIAAAAHRRHEIEQRMRSGEISASRDLQAMDQEVQHLAVRQSRFEEEELALLEEEEPLDTELAEQQGAATALDAELDRLKAAVAVAEAEISVSIGAEEALRAEPCRDSARRAGPAVRTAAVPAGRGGCGPSGGGPMRRVPSDPVVGRSGADPPPAPRGVRHL